MQLHAILQSIEPIIGRNLTVVRLHQALTNATYKICTPTQTWALRCNNADELCLGIDRQRERQVLNALESAHFTPTISHHDEHYLLTQWCDGEPYPQPQGKSLAYLIDCVQEVHQWPTHGLSSTTALDIRSQIQHLSQGKRLSSSVKNTLEAQLQQYKPVDTLCLCHHDWHRHNVLLHHGHWVLIDWEYAALGDPIIDWACVFSGFQFTQDDKADFLALTNLAEAPFHNALALVEMMSLLWYQQRFPQQDFNAHYEQWQSKFQIT